MLVLFARHINWFWILHLSTHTWKFLPNAVFASKTLSLPLSLLSLLSLSTHTYTYTHTHCMHAEVRMKARRKGEMPGEEEDMKATKIFSTSQILLQRCFVDEYIAEIGWLSCSNERTNCNASTHQQCRLLYTQECFMAIWSYWWHTNSPCCMFCWL